MDTIGRLKLKWAQGYRGSSLHYIDNSTLVYSTGNALTFVDSNGAHLQSVSSEGKGIGPLAVCPQAKLIAYAEASLEPLIFIISYPECALTLSLKGNVKLEYTSLCFSADGMKCASLSGIPDFLLTVWDVNIGNVVHEISVGPSAMGASVSYNPLNWKQLCLVGPERISVLTVECCDTQIKLTSIEVHLPDKVTPVGTLVQPGKQTSMVSVIPRYSIVEQREAAGQLVIPDMRKVLYKESYVDKIRKRDPVHPSSYCWTPHASIYIGCDGGQLLLVDFESGAVKVLCNPIPQELDDDDSKKDLNQGAPKTGHAVLSAGSMQCLVLSRRGLYAGGLDGSLYCFEQSSELKIVDCCKLDQPISTTAWTMDYNELAVGGQQGSVYRVDPSDLTSTPLLLFKHSCSTYIGIDIPSTDSSHYVTCCSNGTVQVWSIEDGGSIVGTLSLHKECTSLACPKSSSMAVVGTADGYLCAVSLTDPKNPSFVMKERLYKDPLNIIRYDQNGQFLITASNTGSLFICTAKPSEKLAVVAHTAVEGKIEDVSIAYLGRENQHAAQVAVLSKRCSLITVFFLPDTLSPGEVSDDGVYADSTRLLADDAIMKQQILLSEPATNLALTSSNNVFITLLHSKKLCKLQLPSSTDDKVLEVDVTKGGALFDFGGVPASRLGLSYHQKWLTTSAGDGRITLRLTDSPDRVVQCTPHSYRLGGTFAVVLTTDCQFLLTVGDNRATLTCYQWELTNHGRTKLSSIAESVHSRALRMSTMMDSEDKALSFSDDMEGVSSSDKVSTSTDQLPPMKVEAQTEGSPHGDNTLTWLELATEKAHKAEDEKYADMKSELRKKINDLRAKVMSMMSANEEVPDMEKLEKHEFILDTEEHERLKAEESEQISMVHEEAELANLAKQYLRDAIKQQCWDAMTVKGKVVKTFQGRLEVSNYAMRERSSEELQELERVKALRKCEMAEKKIRDEVNTSMKMVAKLTVDESDDMFMDDSKSSSSDVVAAADPAALMGSRGDKYGGECPLLYNQFELVSPVAKKHQIILLQDCVLRIKETFNKEFDEVLRLKEAEIGRILEKNTRIQKIANDLKVEEHLAVPSLDSSEQPQKLLTVQDDEITVEKYVSPEDKKKLEEAAKAEEERRLKEKGDNWRERALDMMMGGRLEANAEEDLFKDLPRPEFMAKDPTEMTEEEIRMAREFEKKEIAFLEEREKLKKALEAEMKKLQENIQLAMAAFDERVMKLFQFKVKTELVVQQEELKILRLSMSLLVEEEVKEKETELEKILAEKKAEKIKLGGVILQAKHVVDEYKEQYDQIVLEDKELDRAFRRDFSDCEPYVDQLYRLFRRRPKGQKLKVATSISESGTTIDPKTANPFTPRPSSASLSHKSSGPGLSGKLSSEIMADLDNLSNMPEGVEPSQWDRLVAARHKKVDSEQRVKAAALKFAEMNAYLQKRQKEDDEVQDDIQDAFRDLNQVHEDKGLFDMNPYIQFLLRQGQVEVDAGDYVPDFTDSVLIHRSVVEELNSQIKTLGELKLANMAECKDIKRGIRMLEWELRRLHMEAEDLIVKAKDIQMLRVTKELQERLMEENVQGKDQHAIETLEMTFDLNQKTHRRRMRLKQKNLTTLQDEIDKKSHENANLDKQILDVQVSVAEKMNVDDLAGMLPQEAGAESRMKQVVMRRRLVELAKQQAEQVAVLRSEVERLRMRTFPALVQVEN